MKFLNFVHLSKLGAQVDPRSFLAWDPPRLHKNFVSLGDDITCTAGNVVTPKIFYL